MKDRIKQLLVGTPLEPLARKVHSLLTGAGAGTAASDAADKSRDYDLQTLQVMQRVLREDSNCVDVGCHQGSMLEEMLRLSPRGTHFAFEPLPAMYAGLRKKFGHLPNVHLHDCALSDADGTTSFQHVVSNPAYSGLRRRRYDRAHEQVEEIRVETRLLDGLLQGAVPVHFIKVDVEGAELQVFQGAAETIRKHRPVIVFEHGLGGADYYATRPEQVYDLLAGRCGLRLFVMADWLRDSGPGLSREAFCRQFSTGSDYYYMAAA
ncbi:FkbM family methyltransferase [Ramlibacter sp. PS3R-8]|uniref:FkbM family methyltransferase n=1 Tax=Ramlibacter sp. PS3R-8 TaxID=3133437 RepID=UPI0030B2E1D2